MIIVMFLNLYISRLVLKLLGVEDFGIYNVVGGVVALFSYFNSALSATTQRFLNFEMGCGDKTLLNKIFSSSLNVHIFLAILVFIFLETVGLWLLNNYIVIPESRIDISNIVYQFSVFTTVIQIITIPYSALIIAHEDMSVFAYISIIEVLLKLIGVILLQFIVGDKLLEYALVIFVIMLLGRLLYVIYSRLKYTESKYAFMIDISLLKEMFQFTGWNFLGATAGVVMNQGVNIMLNMFFGPIVNASRAIAIQVQQAFAQLATNFTTAINPQIVKSYSFGDKNRMEELVIASSKYTFLIVAATSMPFFIKMDFVLQLWLGEVPQGASSFTKLMLLYQLTLCLTYSLNMSSQASGNVKLFQIVESLTLLLIIPLGFVELKLGMSPNIVLLTQVSLSLLAIFFRLKVLRKNINFNTHKFVLKVLIRSVPVVLCYVLIYIISFYIIPETHSFTCNIVQILFIFILSIFIAYFLGLSSGEKSQIISYILKLKNN